MPRVASTENLRIGGGVGFPIDAAGEAALVAGLAAEFGVTDARAAHAVARYGTDAGRVLAFCRDHADSALADTGYSTAEIRYLVRHEHARTLADVAQRRTSLAITGALSSAAIAETAASWPTSSAGRPSTPRRPSATFARASRATTA